MKLRLHAHAGTGFKPSILSLAQLNLTSHAMPWLQTTDCTCMSIMYT